MAVKIAGIVKNIGNISIYIPIIEAIVNSIESIEQSGRKDGMIKIRLIRDDQIDFSDGLSPIRSIEIEDNGIGFNDDNLQAFDTLYTEYKINNGGKGFGRFTYIKFFQNVHCVSTYKEDSKYYIRKFKFGRAEDIVEKASKDLSLEEKDSKTIITLGNLEDKHLTKLEKKLETIARRLVEKILIFFIDENFMCPTIVLSDEKDELILNEFVKNSDSIDFVGEKEVSIKSGKEENNFVTKVFKLRFAGNQASSVILSAHSREVTTKPLHTSLSLKTNILIS